MAAKAKKSSSDVEVSAPTRGLGDQFRGLDRDPAFWPSIPKYLLLFVVMAGVAGLVWLLMVKSYNEDLQNAYDKEEKLRAEYKTKVQRAVSLDELKKQREQVLQYVTVLEKQLPNKSEMDALLSDINQSGLGRSLQFDLFRPAPPVPRDYYVEQPIALKVTGRYHDIGAFAADVAALSRIVTLNNIAISQPAAGGNNMKPNASDALIMEATAKTFRYLDPDERAANQPRGGRK
jgi:type IV pilus assembly protein PilO